MTDRPVKNVAASVHQRLKNEAVASGQLFNDLLEHYALERILYRLSRSKHAHLFVLKGALLLRVWSLSSVRPTRDIDRMKDFFDIWALAHSRRFDGAVLAEAICATCERRNTAVDGQPSVFSEESMSDTSNGAQWTAFRRRLRGAHAPRQEQPGRNTPISSFSRAHCCCAFGVCPRCGQRGTSTG